MAKLTKSEANVQLRKFRTKVAKLKRKGLISKSVDARNVKMTRHMREQVAKYDDVLTGRAQVLHMPKTSQAKAYAGEFRTKGKQVVVPKETGEKVYRTRKGEIRGKIELPNGKQITKIYPASFKPENLPTGKNVRYSIQMDWGGGKGYVSFPTFRELEEFMNTDSVRNFKNWKKYVVVEIVSGRASEDADEDDF